MRHFSFRPSITMSGRANKGLRGLAGKPLHPPLTDIPIAAYIFAAVFDVVSISVHSSHVELGRQLFIAGTWTMIGGVAVSVFAALTGWADWRTSSEPGTQARRTINAHAITMIVVTVIALVDLVVRLTAYDDRLSSPALIVVLSVVAAALVAFGATLGGGLVFDYGFNVETAGDHPVWHVSETDVLPGHHDAPTDGN
ncbi:MAG: DUF2231 domain-containing protein [Jatrophihabitantaceae bacterium]